MQRHSGVASVGALRPAAPANSLQIGDGLHSSVAQHSVYRIPNFFEGLPKAKLRPSMQQIVWGLFRARPLLLQLPRDRCWARQPLMRLRITLSPRRCRRRSSRSHPRCGAANCIVGCKQRPGRQAMGANLPLLWGQKRLPRCMQWPAILPVRCHCLLACRHCLSAAVAVLLQGPRQAPGGLEGDLLQSAMVG